MTIGELIGTVGSALLGGSLFTYWLGRRKERRADFESIATRYIDENDGLRADLKAATERIEMLNTRIMGLERQLFGLQNKLAMMESAHMDAPLPMWLKDVDGTMLALNQAYEEAFLHPIGKTAADYIGRKDSDMYGEALGKQFADRDRAALSGNTVDVVEDAPAGDGTLTKWRVIKYARKVGRVAVGIAGIAIPHK
jgi:PAS domain-containing protein